MSDQETPILDETPETPDLQVILPPEHSVLIGETLYFVPTFRLGKSFRMMEYLSEAFEQTDLLGLLLAAGQLSDPNNRTPFFQELSSRFPLLLRTARPIIYKALALTIIPDKRLAEIDENDASYEAEIAQTVRMLKAEADLDKALEILILAIDGMGVDQLRKNFQRLLRKLGSG
jgi:hypothetical protein